jgi:hypothetical protein
MGEGVGKQAAAAAGWSRKQARPSFLKKRSKRLLIIWASAVATAEAQAEAEYSKVFCFFFQDRTALWLTAPPA